MNRRDALRAILGGAVMTLAVLLISAAVLSAVTVTRVSDRQGENTETLGDAARAAEAAEKGVDLIQDCTSPGGDCYARSQRRTAAILSDFNQAVVFAAACADKRGVQGEHEIYACVVRLLAKSD